MPDYSSRNTERNYAIFNYQDGGWIIILSKNFTQTDTISLVPEHEPNAQLSL